MQLINLTPHELSISANGATVVIPPSGNIARVATEREESGTIEFQGVQIPISITKLGTPVGLPEEEPDTLLIVSGMVAGHPAMRDRLDVVSPGPAIRDSEGRVIGCDGLVYPR